MHPGASSELDKLNKHLATFKPTEQSKRVKPRSSSATTKKSFADSQPYVLDSTHFGPAPVFQLLNDGVGNSGSEEDLQTSSLNAISDDSPLKLHRDESGKLVLKLSSISIQQGGR